MKKILFSFVSLLIFLSLVFSTKSAESKIFGKGIQKSGGSKTDTEIKEAITMMKTIKFVLDHYKLDNGMYPTTEQGLKALVKKPRRLPCLITGEADILEGYQGILGAGFTTMSVREPTIKIAMIYHLTDLMA